MNNEKILKNLKDKFDECLKKQSCVRVETFYDELKEDNNIVMWNPKIDEDKFTTFLEKTKDPLEVLAEGYRCLSQIYINLLRDFYIFKEYSIRKYSSAYNYISKIEGFRALLKDIGYEEEDKEYKLEVDYIKDEKKITKVALELQIYFMEVMELYKLHNEGNSIPNDIQLRKNNISKAIGSKIEENMTEDEKKKLFEKCSVCESNFNMNGECTGCGSLVTELDNAWKYKEFLKKHFVNLDDSKFKDPPKVEDQVGNNVEKVDKNEKPYEEAKVAEVKKDNHWSCTVCTFINPDDNINCECCSNKRM